MKFRDGFVSNSSSTSFLVVKDKSLDLLDDSVVKKVIAGFSDDFGYETSVDEVRDRVASELGRTIENTVESLTSALMWGSKELGINVTGKQLRPSTLALYYMMEQMIKDPTYKNAIALYSSRGLGWDVKDKLRDTVIGTLTAKLVVDYEKKYKKEVFVMTFASDEGNSAGSLLKYNGLGKVDGCDWVVLGEG